MLASAAAWTTGLGVVATPGTLPAATGPAAPLLPAGRTLVPAGGRLLLRTPPLLPPLLPLAGGVTAKRCTVSVPLQLAALQSASDVTSSVTE
jgi:hypothetical protein